MWFFLKKAKKGEKEWVCRLLLPLAASASAALASFSPASQPTSPRTLSIDAFKWCGIVVWLGDSHSGWFFLRSFVHSYILGGFFTLIFTNAFILDVDCLQFAAFASNLLGKSMYLWLLSYKIVIIIIICGFFHSDAVSAYVHVLVRAHNSLNCTHRVARVFIHLCT